MTFREMTALLALTILLSASQMRCSGKDDGPIRDEEPSNGSEPRVSLSIKYPPGKYEMVQSRDMSTKGTVRVGDRKQAQNSNQKMTQWGEINVTPDTDGKSTMTMEFKRIRQETKGGPMSGVLDTADPGSLSDNRAAKVLTAMTGTRITMKCDANGKVTNVSGMNDMWDRVGREDPQFRPMVGQLKTATGDKAMGDLINKSQEYLPKEPVGVGAVWYAQFNMPVPIAGDMGCEAKCKLISLKPGAAGRIATIEMRARLTSRGSRTTQLGPGSLKIDSMNMTINGQMELNVDTGLMSKQLTTIDGTMSATVQARGQTVVTDATITGTQKVTFAKSQ